MPAEHDASATAVPSIPEMVEAAVGRALERHRSALDAEQTLSEIRAVLGLKPGDDPVTAVKELRANAAMRHRLLQSCDDKRRVVTAERDAAFAELQRVVEAVEQFGARMGVRVEATV